MAETNPILIDRIDERIQAIALSDRKVSLLATGQPDLVRDIRRGKAIGGARLKELARVLRCSVDYLLGTSDVLLPPSPDDPLIPYPQQMEKDIPVFGTALGARAEIVVDGEAIEQTDIFLGEVIDRFRRPPALRDRSDVYALYIQGDSMAPAFESGAGIIVDPSRPPSIRDYAVVYLRGADDGCAAVIIKRLVRRSAGFIELEQFNPAATFRLETKRVAAIHRVMQLDEIIGI